MRHSSIALEEVVNPEASSWLCKDNGCGSCAETILGIFRQTNQTYQHFLNEYHVLGNDFGTATKDRSITKLSCHPMEQMWFDVMRSFGQIGPFLSGFSLFAIVLYFVTSSDSGSLVIDCLSSNGDPDPPAIQRVFWAFMEGATATALLVAGGKDGLIALQVWYSKFNLLFLIT